MKYLINLISQKKEKPIDRLIYFSLNYLRYILVITQIVVIGVFFHRFKVDQEIVDLKEALDQKKEIIEVSDPLLIEAKTTDYSIQQASSIINSQSNFFQSLEYLLSRFPELFFLDKMQFANNKISMSGYTDDANALNAFSIRLKTEKKFKKIKLISLKRTDRGLEFSFEFEY